VISDLNLLDWGKNNILAVALRSAVYLWNESTGKIEQLMELPSQDDYIGSVSWIQEGSILAIGDARGTVQVLLKKRGLLLIKVPCSCLI
jgi:cell division cycle protein 20 (cofactor of APC complex)